MLLRPITKLPITLANQIAAGEVIERPANVVKELLENSLDAGATKIYIDIAQAGIQSIVIRDNGRGIPESELPLAIAPHATSKIGSLEDLESIASFGFRGEALASISSVAEVTLASCVKGHAAFILKSHPDRTDEITPTAHPEGTTLSVQHLFFNVPARRKFLKSEQTERMHIENVIKRLALSHFEVGFFYRYEEKPVLQLPAAQEKSQAEARIAAIMGETFLKGAVFLETEAAGLSLRGWFYFDKSGFSHNEFQVFLVNGRVVKDKIFSHALRQATLSFFEPGRFAGFVLNLTLDPRLVDVNVHPTKSEVRFRYPNQVHDFLLQALTRLISQELSEINMPVMTEMFQPMEAKPTFKTFQFSCYYNRFLMLQQESMPIIIDAFSLKKHAYLAGLVAPIHKKPVLMPIVFELPKNGHAVLQDALAFFEFTQSAENQYVLRAVPWCCDVILDAEGLQLFLEKLDSVKTEKAVDLLAAYFADCFLREASVDKMNQWLNQLSLDPNQHIKTLSSQALLGLFK